MPSVNFVLPHWLYWAGLIVFPIIAMILSRRQRPQPGTRTTGTAYIIWLVGGFLGLHRIYLKNKWGLLYWPLFAVILYAGAMERDARVIYSDAVASSQAIDSAVKRNEGRIKKAENAIEKSEARLAELAQDDDTARERANRRIQKDRDKITDLTSKIAELNDEKTQTQSLIGTAKQRWDNWSSLSFYCFVAIAAFMLFDLLRIPALTRRARAYLEAHPDDPVESEEMADDWKRVGDGLPGLIDRLSLISGEFVAFWSVIAVFVYYYEVIVRYVFNSPTNWAHESMFLMFGMQYLVCGAYAMLTESHVRVDIFYSDFSPRGKAIVDLLTSVFFFIFAGTLLATGWIFAADSIAQGEVSFTEWAIQYWPVKCVIVIGAILLILQGISKLLKDAALVFSPKGA